MNNELLAQIRAGTKRRSNRPVPSVLATDRRGEITAEIARLSRRERDLETAMRIKQLTTEREELDERERVDALFRRLGVPDIVMTAYRQLERTCSTRPVDTSLRYRGTWNARLNRPSIASLPGHANDFYIVTEPGTTPIAEWSTGDWLVRDVDGVRWTRVRDADRAPWKRKLDPRITPDRIRQYMYKQLRDANVADESALIDGAVAALGTCVDDAMSVERVRGPVDRANAEANRMSEIGSDQRALRSIVDKGGVLAVRHVFEFATKVVPKRITAYIENGRTPTTSSRKALADFTMHTEAYLRRALPTIAADADGLRTLLEEHVMSPLRRGIEVHSKWMVLSEMFPGHDTAESVPEDLESLEDATARIAELEKRLEHANRIQALLDECLSKGQAHGAEAKETPRPVPPAGTRGRSTTNNREKLGGMQDMTLDTAHDSGTLASYRRLEQDTRRLLPAIPSRPVAAFVSSLLTSGQISDVDIEIVRRMSVGTPSMHALMQNMQTLQFLHRIK